MKKIFLDANVIIDYLDNSSGGHAVAVGCLRIIRKHFGKPLVSPITFIISNFLLGKFVKNKAWHKKDIVDFFDSKISVVHPDDFVARYNELLN